MRHSTTQQQTSPTTLMILACNPKLGFEFASGNDTFTQLVWDGLSEALQVQVGVAF